MINDKVLEKLSERLTERMAKVNTRVLTIIGKQIKHIGTLNYSTANNLVNMLKYGADFDKIIQEISKATDLNTKEIYKIFEEVAREDLRFAKQFYDYKNKPYIPYEENLMLQREVQILARATADKFLNIANTTAFRINGKDVPLATAYQKIIDESILAVSQGQETYTQAMRKTVNELARNGLRTIDYESGYSRRLDSSVRMHVMDGIGALHNKAQELLAEELGLDGVEISVHENPAPDHEHIQGKQYSNEDFKRLNGIKGADGLYSGGELERPISTMNCYHYIYTILLGVSKPRYTEEELQEIKDNNKKGFEYEGKHYTMYEGTQLQRRIETEVRTQKDIHIMSKASGENELVAESQIKIRQLNKKYKELSEVSGLPTKVERLS